ncbi:MAG TPA: hypothetical protein VHG92_11525 [Afifellaceae bacterium]|nr:hypothetical protein [Afifellaceae bacterium]
MSRFSWISTAAASALLLALFPQDGALAQSGAEERPAERSAGDQAGDAIDRALGAIGEAVDQGAEAVRELDSDDAADLLRRGGEALGTAGERAGEYAQQLAARIEHGDQSRLTVAESAEHGEYVADGEGWALYMFEADTRGEGETEAQSTCYESCAEAWPPLVVDEAPEAGDQLQADLIGTIERRDGALQVTYGGWPLYYWAQDQEPGQTTGHDIEDHGAEWYLVAPSGEQLHD